MKRGWASGLGALLLSGCALVPQIPAPTAAEVAARWATHREAVSAQAAFQLQGRVATPEGSASLRWTQFADGRYHLRLSGPLSLGAVVLRGDAAEVEIVTREGKRISQNPQSELERLLGWPLALGTLSHWARGLPDNTSAAQLMLDENGRALSLTQNGWTLDYPEYRAAGPLLLPARLEARAGERRIGLIADSWTLLP